MAPLVACSKVISSHRSVNLGGGQINVAQQLLDRPQICAALEEVRRKRMPEGVWEAGHASIENTSDPALIECTSTYTHEQGPSCAGRGELGSAPGEPPVEGTSCRTPHRYHTLTLALAGDRDEVGVDVADREPGNLRDPHAGRIQQLEQCSVADRGRVVTVDGVDRLGDGSGWERVRKRARWPGGVDPNRRVGNHDRPFDAEFEKAADRRHLAGDGSSGIATRVEVGDPSPHRLSFDCLQVVDTEPIAEVQEHRHIATVGIVGVLREASCTEMLSEKQFELCMRPTGDGWSGCHTLMLRGSRDCPVTIPMLHIHDRTDPPSTMTKPDNSRWARSASSRSIDTPADAANSSIGIEMGPNSPSSDS